MKTLIGKVTENADPIKMGRILVKVDQTNAMWVFYTTPYDGNKGGFLAIPEIGSFVLICQPDNSEEWYYLNSIVSPQVGDSLGKWYDKSTQNFLIDDQLYKARGVPQRQTFSSPKGNKLVLSDEYGPDYANIKASLESSNGKSIELIDSPLIDAIIIKNEKGDRIKISTGANGSSAANSIEIECTGPLSILSRESSIEMQVIDGKEINIVNKSTGSKRRGPTDPTPGNINIQSTNGDINVDVKSNDGVVRIDAEGNNGFIVLNSKGGIQINGDKGVSITSNDGDVTIQGQNINLN